MRQKLTLSSISLIALVLAACSAKTEHSVRVAPFAQSSPEGVAHPVVIAGGPHQTAHLPFDWAIYDDPSRPEFWADGADGILPRPFLYLAGNPTKENAAKLIAWQKRQWKAIEGVIKALGGASEIEAYSNIIGENIFDHLAGQESLFAAARTEPVLSQNQSKDTRGVNWSDVGVVYIYRSDCPHCQKETPVIEGVRSLGARVIALQLDDGPPLHEGSKPYASGDWPTYFPLGDEMATPTLFIHKQGQKPFKHTGYLSLGQLTEHIKQIGEKI